VYGAQENAIRVGALLVIAALLCFPGGAVAQARAWKSPPADESRSDTDPPATFDRDLAVMLPTIGPDETVTVVVLMRRQADLSGLQALNRSMRLEAAIRALQSQARSDQARLASFLLGNSAPGAARNVIHFWIINAVVLSATPDLIYALSARSDVAHIALSRTFEAPGPVVPVGDTPSGDAAANLEVVGVPELWDMGVRGQGVVIASLDTGVSYLHPDLFPKWRGGTNSWFDPYGQHTATPVDLTGHGTQVLGVIVAGDASGVALGVAPDAQWIAARIFDDRGRATTAGILAALQWLLDPDGDPSTPDAPHVANGSWGSATTECDTTFHQALSNLRLAGILPVFAAGNFGPASGSNGSPANYPEVLAAGATDNDDALYAASSRGPSNCTGGAFPSLVAPGVDIPTTERYGLYTTQSGTSLAAAHVTGAAALLWSAIPGVPLEQIESMLLSTAEDLGPEGPDYDYGVGRLDVAAAYRTVYRYYFPHVVIGLP